MRRPPRRKPSSGYIKSDKTENRRIGGYLQHALASWGQGIVASAVAPQWRDGRALIVLSRQSVWGLHGWWQVMCGASGAGRLARRRGFRSGFSRLLADPTEPDDGQSWHPRRSDHHSPNLLPVLVSVARPALSVQPRSKMSLRQGSLRARYRAVGQLGCSSGWSSASA